MYKYWTMKYSREAIKKTWGAVSIGLAFFAIIAANYSKIFDDIIKWLAPANNVEVYSSIYNIYTKILLVLIIFLIFSWIYISFLLVYDLKTISLRKYDESNILKQIEKYKTLNEIVVFGYSLSFAESIRLYLENQTKKDLAIKIIIPSESYIKEKLIDDQTKESRTEEIKARLIQWEKLKSIKRVKDVVVRRVDSIPIENGFIINDEVLYIDYYNWAKVHSGNFELSKKPRSERGFIKIKKRNADLYNYVKNQINSK